MLVLHFQKRCGFRSHLPAKWTSHILPTGKILYLPFISIVNALSREEDEPECLPAPGPRLLLVPTKIEVRRRMHPETSEGQAAVGFLPVSMTLPAQGVHYTWLSIGRQTIYRIRQPYRQVDTHGHLHTHTHTHRWIPLHSLSLSVEALRTISVQCGYLSVIWRCSRKLSSTSSEQKTCWLAPELSY